MFDARRPLGWLFLLLPAMVALAVSAQTLPITTISDTVYRADGTPTGGTLLISWPEFTTAAQGEVATGNTSVTLGAGGGLSVGLVPNANATPQIRSTPSYTHWMIHCRQRLKRGFPQLYASRYFGLPILARCAYG
jgi:hypothetical protein